MKQIPIIEYQEDERENELMCKLSGCLLLVVFMGIIAVTILLMAI